MLCSVPPADNVATQKGSASAWFVLEAQECSNCLAGLLAEATLDVPAGVNYDLFLWSSCNTLVASSTNATGQAESVLAQIASDSPLIDNTRDYFLEVRYVGGSSCAEWTLNVIGSACQP